ncbi:histidine--tRNA ligase [Candidatus Saccharibacteria bacterium]|nr:histidine--tRNA ligase [Candidatus Saccharibacteria bacterium]
MAKQQFQTVRGMYDITPDRWPWFNFVMSTFEHAAVSAGFGRVETPSLEDEGLFSRSIGEGTDVIDKEMYTLTDRGDKKLVLRPEGTAGIARAYLEHGMGSLPQPVKMYYIESMFRYDRPQEGRYREHRQVGLEVIGDASPSADAQVITLVNRVYRRLRLPNVTLQINSIGDAACRPKYRKALVDYLTTNEKQLAEVDRARLAKNPLRVLDSKEASTQVILSDVPQTLNYLCDACQQHFAGVLEYLDDLGIAYELNPLLVRGLDYYTRTVFEFYGEREGAQASLGGGGRYDGLLEQIGGQPTSAVGFAGGIERVILELEAAGVALPDGQPKRVYVASLGEPARLAAFRLIESLLDGDVPAVGAVDRDGIGAQLARADKLGVPLAIIIGQKEVREETVLLRDMTNGAQETLSLSDVVAELRSRFNIV